MADIVMAQMTDTDSGKEGLAAALRADIAAVAALRGGNARDPQLRESLLRLKSWQSDRLGRTYADLLADERYRPAAMFFLADLYGPKDFGSRDEQLAKVVPLMCTMLPAGAIRTVGAAVRLDLLSESLDRDMALAAAGGAIDEAGYGAAYRAVGRRADREAQIALMAEIGRTLDAMTTSRSFRAALALMRKPAQVAGLGALQEFLEHGFAAFRHMRGADRFLATIAGREREILRRLFDADPRPFDPRDPIASSHTT
jgi:hypothetical protein